MGNCKDCRFWLYQSFQEWGECRKVMFEQDEHYNVTPNPDSDESLMKVYASAPVYDLIEKGLQTRPDFGCVQFEAKEAAQSE